MKEKKCGIRYSGFPSGMAIRLHACSRQISGAEDRGARTEGDAECRFDKSSASQVRRIEPSILTKRIAALRPTAHPLEPEKSVMRLYRIYRDEGLAVRRLKRKRLSRPEAKTLPTASVPAGGFVVTLSEIHAGDRSGAGKRDDAAAVRDSGQVLRIGPLPRRWQRPKPVSSFAGMAKLACRPICRLTCIR